jgi:hypothetical protein
MRTTTQLLVILFNWGAKMNIDTEKDIERISEYLKLYEELGNFIISRKVFKTLVWWASIYAIFLSLFVFLGAKAYIITPAIKYMNQAA